MGLFSSNKKKERNEKSDLPPLKFPDLPSDQEDKQFASETKEIKQAVAPPQPTKQPSFQEANFEEEKPLFIRVEKYKKVLETLDELKTKLKDANEVLKELNQIKEDEEKELAIWSKDLELIKEKLMNIDQNLFETE